MRLSHVIILIENCNVFLKEAFLGIFGELFEGGQEINFAHTALQAKSGDVDSKLKVQHHRSAQLHSEKSSS